MKNILCLVLLISTSSFAQILEPVTWSISVEKISDLEYTLVFTAEIDDTWHLYSQEVPKDGPLPTVFKFNSSPDYDLINKVSEEKGKTVYEEVFEMDTKYFENKAIFKQHIKLKNNTNFKITGDIEYMTCNSEKCIQGYDNFQIKI